jgi:hypothetical protein
MVLMDLLPCRALINHQINRRGKLKVRARRQTGLTGLCKIQKTNHVNPVNPV